METGGEDIREHGQVQDLLHGAVLVRELQQVPVGVGHQHIVGLAAHPAAHIHIAVGAAGAVRVHVQADTGLALLAVPAAAAGDVERYRAEVADLDEFDVAAHLNHFAGNFVAENQVGRSGGPPTHHVLVRTADVGGHGFEDHTMVDRPSHVRRVDARAVFEFKAGVVNINQFNLARLFVGNGFVPCHLCLLLSRGPHCSYRAS
jgi:hypothetical protein